MKNNEKHDIMTARFHIQNLFCMNVIIDDDFITVTTTSTLAFYNYSTSDLWQTGVLTFFLFLSSLFLLCKTEIYPKSKLHILPLILHHYDQMITTINQNRLLNLFFPLSSINRKLLYTSTWAQSNTRRRTGRMSRKIAQKKYN